MSQHTPIPQTSLRPPRPPNYSQTLGTGNNPQPKPSSVKQLTPQPQPKLPAVGVAK